MDDNSFSIVLKKIRNDYGFTQEEAAEDVCSLRHYKRIEAGEITPSAYVLNDLSKKFNYDFSALYNALNVDGADVYKWKATVSMAIARKDFTSIREYIDSSSSLPQVRSILMIKQYLKGLLLLHNNVAPNEVISTLLDGLRLESPFFSLNNIEIRSNEGLCILNLYATCLVKQEQYSDAEILFKYMVDRLSSIIETNGNFYCSSSFIDSFYPKCTGSYANLLIKEKKYRLAISEITKAAKTLQSHYAVKYLHLILWKKVEILCILKETDEAKKTFGQMRVLCELLDYNDFLDRKTKFIKEMYDGIL